MLDSFQHLEWDSNIFGFPVSRISSELPVINRAIIDELKTAGYRLAYYSISAKNHVANNAALKCGGFLAAQNVTYLTTLSSQCRTESIPLVMTSCIFAGTSPTKEMEDLSIESGRHSRYRSDPLFPEALFRKLYVEWINRSITRKIAQEVLVATHDGKIVGMITLVVKQERGVIGLLSVDRAYQGSGIGKTLVSDAKRWFSYHGCHVGEVVTQISNSPACRLYEACGFHISKIENIYHFWM